MSPQCWPSYDSTHTCHKPRHSCRESSGSRARLQARLEITHRYLIVDLPYLLLYSNGVVDTNSTTRNKGMTPIECIEKEEPVVIVCFVGCEWDVDIRWGRTARVVLLV